MKINLNSNNTTKQQKTNKKQKTQKGTTKQPKRSLLLNDYSDLDLGRFDLNTNPWSNYFKDDDFD